MLRFINIKMYNYLFYIHLFDLGIEYCILALDRFNGLKRMSFGSDSTNLNLDWLVS